ncbi:DUF3466 family protein [Paraglaciecola sp. L1A13]|uniref:DUF3466 family protein n=1 Tax=Paraglaciecola sp. L1A13 TaxID=2686359 RepID=UPI00131DE66E|nr:DUF3466 family protein [Paraglaciecola sp. L1A13]
MKKTRLAALLSSAFLSIPSAFSAQYEVVEIPAAQLGEDSYPSAINDIAEITVNLISQYNPVIDVTLLDFDSATLIASLTNIENAKSGDFNTADYELLYTYIVANDESQFFQQIASINSYVATEDTSTLLHGFDTIDSNTDDYRNSAKTTVRGINESGYTVGLSYDGFYTLDYVNENIEDVTYVLNDFYARAFAQIGDDVIELAPPDDTIGGYSEAYDINELNQVVGIATTELVSDTLEDSIEACNDEDERGDVPVESCLRNLSINTYASLSTVFQRRGVIWQLDDGNVTDTLELPMLIEPDDDDTTVYSSTAVAINDFGIAVGTSPAYYNFTDTLTSAAVIYDNDKAYTISEDNDEEYDVFASYATDINNNDLVVGYATKSVLGSSASKFFVYDYDTGLIDYPDDFFDSASTIPTAINDDNMVVGYTEYEETSSGVRRVEGFLYDYRNDIFSGLNDLIECNSPYTIAQANGINENNEIIATATISTVDRDITGEIALDEYDAESYSTHVVAVKLVPIAGGSIDNCDVYEEEYERQGSSVYWLLFIGLLGFGRFIGFAKK